MNITNKEIEKFQKKILEWYEINKRDLPWRRTRDPYAILVSEVMSQQTQISRVVFKYYEWMKRFPTVEKLAEAQTREVLTYWNGLGYNRRALYLQRLAIKIVKDFKGIWPQDEKTLFTLPGIGEYTARALLCFAFGKEIAVVDTNVRKVILTHFKHKELMTKEDIQEIADTLLPKGKAYVWNQALMDYASAMLKEYKIPIPKQSHFKTSNRFYRGQVIRLLLKKKLTIDQLFESLENNGITKEKFVEILIRMEKEGFIQKKAHSYFLL